MPVRRKLFIAHASELAYRCVRSLRRDGLIAEFVRSYAARYNRSGLSIDPGRNREFDSAIGREALLVMAARIQRMLPAAFASRPGKGRDPRNREKQLAPEEATLSAAFYAEFLASLGRSLEWVPSEVAAEADAFRRDLEMYQRWTGRSAVRRITYASAGGPGESPFADRCALLLDPEMMEQARRASSEFEGAITRTAARIFSQLGRSARPAPRAALAVKPRRSRARKRLSGSGLTTRPKKRASPHRRRNSQPARKLLRFRGVTRRKGRPRNQPKKIRTSNIKRRVKKRAKKVTS